MKNYTSTVAMEKTVAKIEVFLIQNGARDILKNYDDDGKLTGIVFQVRDPKTQKMIPFRLPSNVDGVYKWLLDQRVRITDTTRKTLRAQAERTAWKTIQDWVEVQMSMIEMEQASLVEIFLPYVWDGEKTYFQRLEDNGFKALPAGVE